MDLNRAESIFKELDAYSLIDTTKRVRTFSNYSEFSFGWASFIAYAVLLIGVFILQERYDLIAVGRVDALAIVEGGQYCRSLTALNLQADIVHLVSNLMFGGFTLLGLIGVGDGFVDVAAHISGFICGIVLGIFGAVGQRAFVALERCKAIGVCAVSGLIALAWFLALSAA